MVSIILSTQVNCEFLDSTDTVLSSVKGDSFYVLGKLSVEVSFPALRRKFTWCFYIANVQQNLLGMDF